MTPAISVKSIKTTSNLPDPEVVYYWTNNDVHEWLLNNGFKHLANLIAFEQKVDGPALLLITEDDLRQPPLSLPCLGDIKRLSKAINELKSIQTPMENGIIDEKLQVDDTLGSIESMTQQAPGIINSVTKVTTSTTSDGYQTFRMITREEFIRQIESPDTKIKSLLKLALAFIYCSISLFTTAFVMVIVHDRVPDMKLYPPLPDLVLDNLPLIPWAFELCEMIGVCMATIWLTILIFHKERVVIMRRMFSLVGTVFLLRCVTMLITSLSVPGVHLACRSKTFTTIPEKFRQAFHIWSKLGMSINNVRSCGDYLFSGHTTVITLLNHLITEYTPENWHMLHTATWIMNFFAIFFILAGHEHYSIDVFIAFYISSRMFLYYHTYAYNHNNLTSTDARMRLWFPLGWFFESGGVGRVENVFDLPFSFKWKIKKTSIQSDNGMIYTKKETQFVEPVKTKITTATTTNGHAFCQMSRENQTRKAVSLTDLRSGEQSVLLTNESCHNDQCLLFCVGHQTLSQSTTMLHTIVNPIHTWSHYSEDDSGIETSSDLSGRRSTGLHHRHRLLTEKFSTKLIRGKIQKRANVAPYLTTRSSTIRRKSIHEFRLSPILSNRGLLKYTRVFQKNNCIYVGKAATMALENGDYEDLTSMPSSSSSTSDSPSYILTSPPRCNLNFNQTRRRHSLYAKVYSGNLKIPSVAEEESGNLNNCRSVVQRLDLDRSSSCVETSDVNHQNLFPTSSVSADFCNNQIENTLSSFNSLCISMKNDEQQEFSDMTDSLCSQFLMMMPPNELNFSQQSHSTGHSPFSSTNLWTNSTTNVPSVSATDLLTPIATDQ